jgi:hypothetical protein
MAKTFSKKINKLLLQPVFTKNRQKYRGHRSSVDENREANFFLIDINKINNFLSKSESDINLLSENFVGNLTNLTDQESLSDGLFYNLTDIKVYYQDVYDINTPSEIVLNLSKMNRLSAIVSRIEKKVKLLEGGV